MANRRFVTGRTAPEQFACFDGLRAIAASAVLFHHAGFDTGTTFRHDVFGGFLARGDIGVSIFFAISGFLLYRPFVAAHLDDSGTKRVPSARSFWWKRALRIFPAYWLALTGIIVFFGLRVHGWRDAVTFYGLIQIYDRHRFLGGLVQAWSLCTEISFYLVLPLLAYAVGRAVRTMPKARRVRVELIVVIALYLASVAWRVMLYTVDPSIKGIALFWLPGQLDHFAIGMGLAVLSAAGVHYRPRPWLWWTGAVAAFVIVAQVLDVPRGLATIPSSTDLGRQALYGVVALCLLVPAVFGPANEGFIRRSLQWAPIAYVGFVSYGVYLWHKAFVEQIRDWTGSDNFHGNWFIVAPLTLVASVVVAALSWHLLERPLLRWKNGPPGFGRASSGASERPTTSLATR